MKGRKKTKIDMEMVYKLKEKYKTNKEIAEILTKEGVEVSYEIIRRRLKENPYPIWKKENFKQIKLEGLENFWVSKGGDIFNSKTQVFLKPSLNTKGYYQTSIKNNGVKFKYVGIHKIVYCVWNNIYELGDREVHHRDENKTNNNIDNLELTDKGHGRNYNNTKVANDNIDKIINEYKSGLSSIKIAEEWDVGHKFILKMLKDNNIKIRKSGGQKTKLPMCLIAMWRNEGMSYQKIANKLNKKCNIKTNRWTIRMRLKEYYENIPNNN